MLFNSELKIVNSFSEDARIIIHQGDTLRFLKEIPSKIIKLVVTSPPYNIGKEYEKSVSLDDYLVNQENVISEIIRIVSDDGSICWETGNYIKDGEVFPLDIFYYYIFKKNNLFLRNRIVWHFGHGLHSSKRFSGRYETILWFTKGNNYTFNLDNVRIPAKYPGKRQYKGPNKGKPSCNPKGKNPSDFWEFLEQEWQNAIWDIPNVKANHCEKTIHPCQFPIELVERCILALTNRDDWVLDPYAGVLSTLIAAIKNNRRTVGIEIVQKYIDIGKKRINDLYNGSLKIRPLGTKVYQPTGKEKVSQIPKEWRENNLW